MLLRQIPMRRDNYSYAVQNGDEVIFIDPSAPDESARFFDEHPQLKLIAILNTHSHPDHVGGNGVLYEKWRCPVYGPALEKDRVPHLSHALSDGDRIALPGFELSAHGVEAHTIGHLAYLCDHPLDVVIKHGHQRKPYTAKDLAGQRAILVGDSLFGAGCGRLFEGTTDHLVSAMSFYQQLDSDILMVCAHEYTKNNLRFAANIFPNVDDISDRLADIDRLIKTEGSSIPCPLLIEQKTNPFLLVLKPPYRQMMAKRFDKDVDDLAGIMGALRAAKDNF